MEGDTFIFFGKLLAQGGWPLYPLYLCSFVALIVIFYKYISFRAFNLSDLSWKEEMMSHIHSGDFKQAAARCDLIRHPAARVIKTIVKAFSERPDLVKSEAHRVASLELQKLEAYLSVLSFIAQVAPLLGLLGTVIGMVDLFIGFQGSNNGDINITQLSAGIWKALITTAAGLTIAVPTFAAYSYLTSRVDNVRLQLSDIIQNIIYVAPQVKNKAEVSD